MRAHIQNTLPQAQPAGVVSYAKLWRIAIFYHSSVKHRYFSVGSNIIKIVVIFPTDVEGW